MQNKNKEFCDQIEAMAQRVEQLEKLRTENVKLKKELKEIKESAIKNNFGTDTFDVCDMTRNSTVEQEKQKNTSDSLNKLRKKKFKSSKNLAGMIADTGNTYVYSNEPRSAALKFDY